MRAGSLCGLHALKALIDVGSSYLNLNLCRFEGIGFRIYRVEGLGFRGHKGGGCCN